MTERESYYYLKKGDVIQEGDEVDACDNPWKDAPVWQKTTCVGELAPDPMYPAHRIYRREIPR